MPISINQPVSNVYSVEGISSADAGTITVSAPWAPVQWVISNDTSGKNMALRLYSTSAVNKEMTIGGLESLSIYHRGRSVSLSAKSDWLSYRVWAFG